MKIMAVCFIVCFIIAALMTPLGISVASSGSGKIVVLTFHEVVKSENEVSNSVIICKAELEKTILNLLDRGYQFVTPEEFQDYFDGKLELSGKKNILFTFDDGYEGVWKYAFPVLNKYGISAIFFPVMKWYTSFPRQEPHRPHLTASQTLELMRAGWILGGHTYDGHWRPDGKTPFLLRQEGESEFIYELRLYWDILLMKREMSRLGCFTGWFAFPYGAYNATVVEMLKGAGFKYLFTSEPGLVKPGDKIIPRISVGQTAEETIRVLEGLDW